MELIQLKAKSSGYTLIEMLVTVLIAGVLAMASIPLIIHILSQNRLKSAAETFASHVQVARSEAVQRQQDVYLNLVTGSSWCYGINANSACSCSASTCSLASVSGSTYPSISVAATGFTGNDIYFDSVRALPDEAAEVDFQGSGKTIRVTISRLGKMALCSNDITGYPAC